MLLLTKTAGASIAQSGYGIYPKYWNTLTPYHTQLKILTLLLLNLTSPFLANSVDPDQLASEEASEEANWSGSTLLLNMWIFVKNWDQAIWLAGN